MAQLEIGNRLKRLRKFKELTLDEVAERADVTKGFISQLERDLTVPSITTLKQVLDVYGESLSSFFKDNINENKKIFQVNDRFIITHNSNIRYEQLAPKVKYLEMEPVLLTIKEDKQYKTTVDDTELFGFIMKGKILFNSKDEEKELNKAECFYLFYGDTITMKNIAKGTAEILLVSY